MFQGEDLAGDVRRHRDSIQYGGNPDDTRLHCKDKNGCSALGAVANRRTDYTLNS